MAAKFHNRTRQAASIPRKLLQEGKPYLLPLYYLLLTSELAAEGISNSGSYRFADHIYAGRPQGKFLIGWIIDAISLKMPSARAFRARYLYAKAEITRLVRERGAEADRLDILAVPSGFAREVFEAAAELRADPGYSKIHWHLIDLDPEVITQDRAKASAAGVEVDLRQGDALNSATYNSDYDLVISMGFAEFVPDEILVDFYRLLRSRLKPGGRFVTSGMLPHGLSDYLLRNIGELHTFYRSAEQLRELALKAGFTAGRTYHDKTGLQTMLVCVRE